MFGRACSIAQQLFLLMFFFYYLLFILEISQLVRATLHLLSQEMTALQIPEERAEVCCFQP